MKIRIKKNHLSHFFFRFGRRFRRTVETRNSNDRSRLKTYQIQIFQRDLNLIRI